MTTSFATPDVRELAAQGLPKDSFPANSRQAYRVYFAPAVHQQIIKHAAEGVPVEICGVLVGKWGQDENGPFVAITECIRCEEAQSKFAEVTFTHESWAKINQEMDTRFADLRIAGWYHSHPDFGIFLSDRDQFIQEHFFSAPGQVAFVVDPIRKTEGMFIWREGKAVPCEYYWIGDRIRPSMAEERAAKTSAKGPTDEPQAGARQAAQGADSLYLIALRTLACLALFLLGYYVAQRQAQWDLSSQMTGKLGIELGLRYGATNKLEEIDANVRDLAGQLQDLVKAQPVVADAAASTPEEQRRMAALAQTIAVFNKTQQNIQRVRKDYAFSPDEMEEIRRFRKETEKTAPKSDSPDAKPAAKDEKGSAAAAGAKNKADTGTAEAPADRTATPAPAAKEKPADPKSNAKGP